MSRGVKGDNRKTVGGIESRFSATFGVEGSSLDDPDIIRPTPEEREDRKMRRARKVAQQRVDGTGAVDEARRYLARKREERLDLSPEEKITQAVGWFTGAILLACVVWPLLRGAWPHVGEAIELLTRAWKGRG